MDTQKEYKVIKLPRGGVVVKTSAGLLQFGSPPETIKDTMLLPEGVPSAFLLPGKLFHVEKGIAVAELEFPIYYNYFLKNQKVFIICTQEQKEQLLAILQESVFGPEHLNIENDFAMGESDPALPDMYKETKFFSGSREMSDIVEFGVFQNDEYNWNGVVVRRKKNLGFFIYENLNLATTLPWSIEYNIRYDIGQRLATPFEAPDFAITCLGPSHGFDPKDNTSGFILWLSGRGIMIDPPVNSTEWLRSSNVNPKLITHVILTHCHADHDAGTFQKILEENTITIHTTETVMDSFLRKYSAMTKISSERLRELFYFKKVLVNEPIYIEHGEFIFHYALHSIPTIGFKMRYQNQTFVYSSDHLNDPEQIKKIAQSNIFSNGRLQALLDFPWDSNIIYHEAGIAPLHTPIEYLISLPKEIQKKVTVYHIAEKDFPKNGHDLRLAKFGIKNTLFPKVEKSKFAKAISILDVMVHVDLFSNFSASKARDFLALVEKRSYKKGERIIEKGTMGNEFYMIASGVVSILGTESSFEKKLEKYDYFGESSLVTEQPRAAEVIAETDVDLLFIDKKTFFYFIEGTQLEKTLQHLAKTRQSNSWDVLNHSPVFSAMTSYQKNQIELVMHKYNFTKNEKLLFHDQSNYSCFILIDGEVDVLKNGRRVKKNQTGSFIGDVYAIEKKSSISIEAFARSDGSAYKINGNDMAEFLYNNPGVYMRLLQKTI